MRLWHWKLISYLPKQQLLGQWRECCLIARNIAEKGTPNHILVNPIMDYPEKDFLEYSKRVYHEMKRRGYRIKAESFFCHCAHIDSFFVAQSYFNRRETRDELFPGWHTPRYLTQCLANLEEKHDRGGIPDDEWNYLLKSIGRSGKSA